MLQSPGTPPLPSGIHLGGAERTLAMTLGARPPRFLAAGLLLAAALAGCSSDATAPQDRLTLTVAEAAGQSGLIAWAAGRVAPHFLMDPAAGVPVAKRADTLDFSGQVTGTATIVFTDAGDAATTWNLATHGHLFTGAEPLKLYPNAGLAAWIPFALDFTADIDRTTPPGTATVAGSGSIGSGATASTFALAAVTVPLSGYPSTGTMTLHIGGHVAVITFNGAGSVPCLVDGTPFTVNLASGAVTAG